MTDMRVWTTWGPVVPGRTTTKWEENHYSDPFASQTSWDGQLGRCDGPGRLGSFGRLGRSDGPDGLGRGTGLSRLLGSSGSRLDSGGREGDCVQLSSCCRPSTGSGHGSCRLSTPTGLSRWQLGKGWRVGGPGYPSRDYASCKTRHFHGFWCQQSDVSVSSEKYQPGDLSWLYVNVDSHAMKDELGYGSSRHPVQAHWSDTDDQTPTTRHDQTLPRRSGTAVRHSRTPVRWPRTAVRRSRGMGSRDSTRSRSSIRRSSSSESCTRDASPVDFSAALNTEEKVKDRSISEEEDDKGSQKKVSAAQYQLFRQAVTSSKGMFKVNPSKSRRAPRASLIDLGESEVSDSVSWLDQPSLVDTMASTARIAQRLKEDEDEEKATLSETLNTSSLTFKHLTVKQIFPREPFWFKVHIYPSLQQRLVSAIASYQISQRMCLDREELARRSAIYASLADLMVASMIEELSPKDQRSKLLLEKLTIIQEAQVAAVSAGFAGFPTFSFYGGTPYSVTLAFSLRSWIL